MSRVNFERCEVKRKVVCEVWWKYDVCVIR
jgi:hypothetical protein